MQRRRFQAFSSVFFTTHDEYRTPFIQRLRISVICAATLASTANAPNVSRIMGHMISPSLSGFVALSLNECARDQLNAERQQADKEPASKCFRADASAHALSDSHPRQRRNDRQ
ncbi:hypothetical protein SAMN05443245_1925 [Paraburkholderia fungorum]|uniref:Uncharacterized protein n=1 Tax=Paraburkholderia fungorum TaxID=134537 RepID=A0A1H1C1Q5_9BURK|nr:hypothetical protein SAMN05443245_1925 [Paraburkholderia fungorum]